jgi:hypothetical protein
MSFIRLFSLSEISDVFVGTDKKQSRIESRPVDDPLVVVPFW